MSNVWAAFASLLPARALRVGTALTVYEDDTALLELPQGGRVRIATGGVSVMSGSRYFFKAGRIEGEAPALPTVEVEVF